MSLAHPFVRDIFHFIFHASSPLYSWPYMNLWMIMPSLGELRMREWRAVPTIAVRAPRALAVRMRRLYSEV